MKLLIDTHTFLWCIHDDPNLSDRAASLLESDADLLLSTASLWEIAIKVNLQKLTLPDAYEIFGVAESKYDLPSSPTLLPKEKGARTLVPSPTGRGLG
jgi:PIN domain nuclease of toxin-antitoxin system